MSKLIYLNLPVKDLVTSTHFYEAIGCKKNEKFSDENAASMVWSDTIAFQLMTHSYYSTFAAKAIADPHQISAILIALTQASRTDVDAIVAAAATAGGRADIRAPQDLGFIYIRAFEDPDGNIFEAMCMNSDARSEKSA